MSGEQWYRKEHSYVRSRGAALLRNVPAQARDSLRYYEVAGVLAPFRPAPPLDQRAPRVPGHSFWYFVITDWTLYICGLAADGLSQHLEVPWLALLDVDAFIPKHPFQFSDDDVRCTSKGILLRQMVERGGAQSPSRKQATRHAQSGGEKSTRSLRFWSSRRPSKSPALQAAEDAMSATLLVVTIEAKSALHYHMSRAWMGAHMRVALHRSRAPETPNWFTPPISTASFRLAARGLDAGWFIDMDDFQWRQQSYSDEEHHSDYEPRTPKQQTRKPGLADQDNSPDSTLSGPYSDSPMKRFLATTGALSSKGTGGGLTSRSIRFGNSGLNRYGYSLTAARQSLTPHRSNVLMTPSRADLCEASGILREVEKDLAAAMHCHTLDERDALLLREAADEANFCSSSMARQMQAALFKSDTLLKFSVVKLQEWLETCIRLGDGTVQRAVPLLHRLETGSPDRMEILKMHHTATFRQQQLANIEEEAHRLSSREIDELVGAGENAMRKYRPDYASRVGKGEQSLSETLRSSRAFGSSADAVEDGGSVYGSRIFSPGALRKSSGGFGSPLRRSAASSIWEETGSLRGSKAEFANRRDSAIRTSRRLGDDASRPARGRRWSFLVGRLLAVTAWQKTRLLLQLLQRVLHHSEGCPHRLTWMSAKGFIRMGQGEDDVMSRRACTQTLARLLLQVHTPFRGHVPILENTFRREEDTQKRSEGPLSGMWWCTSDTDFATLDLLVACLHDLLGLSHQAQVTNSEAHDGVLDAIIDIPESLLHSKMCAMFTRLTSLMLDANPPAIDFDDIPTPQELISVIAYRTASVLATLLDTVPGAAQRMQDQFLEELKYVILEQRLPKPPTFGQDSAHFLLYHNDRRYREIVSHLMAPNGVLSEEFAS